jgi:hypothetical protein
MALNAASTASRSLLVNVNSPSRVPRRAGVEWPLLLDLENHGIRRREPVRLSLRAITNRLLDAAADLLLRALGRHAERRVSADLFLHRDGTYRSQ